MADKPNGTQEISSKEFQRKLFDWFEKRGLLSELRAFMRHRMIAALYSSESPCPVSHFASPVMVSPSIQAILLLVAEFLVQQECHYTMSVMVAEVPLLASFPKFSNYVSYMSNSDPSSLKQSCDFPRYNEKDVLEILSVLGITADSESAQHILRLYSNNNARESLLACVLTALSAILQHSTHSATIDNKPDSWVKRAMSLSDATPWIEDIRLVLLRAQLTAAQLQQVEDLIRKLHADTAEKVRREEKERQTQSYHIREQQLLAESLKREEKFRMKLQDAEEDLRKKQIHLELVTSQLRQQHDEVLNRLNRVQRHADEVRRQETELSQREKAIEEKQAVIAEEHRALTGLRAELQEAAQSLKHEHSDNKTLLELNRLQDRCSHLEAELEDAKNHLFSLPVSRTEVGVQASNGLQGGPLTDEAVQPQQLQHSTGSSESSCNLHSKSEFDKPVVKNEQKERKNSQVTLLKHVLCRVQQENSELRAITAQQRRRIDELTTRAADLATHLAEQPRTSVQAQNENFTSVPQVPQQLPRALHVPYRSDCHNSQLGASGDLIQSGVQSARPQGRDWRRKQPKRLIQHSSLTTSFSSDESPTEEIMREARNRLRKLEEESEAVDRNYRNFRARQADNLTSTAAVLLVPAPLDPVQTSTQLAQESQGVELRSSNLFRASPLASSDTTVPRTSILASSLHSRATATSQFNSVKIPQSQFTFPERSSSLLFHTGTFSKLSQSLPHHPSVLRRPMDRLRNVLGRRSSFYRDTSAKDEGTQTKQEKSVSSNSLSPNVQQNVSIKNPTNLEKADPNASKTVVGLQTLSLEVSSDRQLNPNLMITKENHEEPGPTESCLAKEKSKVDDFPQKPSSYSPQFDGNQVSGQMAPSFVAEIEDLAQTPVFTLNGDNPEKQTFHSSHRDEQRAKKQLFTQPLVQPTQCNQPEFPQDRNEKADVKSSATDTLSGISVISTSPGLPSPNEENAKSEKVAAKENGLQPENNESVFPTLVTTIGVQKSKINYDSFVSKTASTPGNESHVFEKANQLLNTSLSSIDKTDQHLSAGSGGKKSEDDDDFW